VESEVVKVPSGKSFPSSEFLFIVPMIGQKVFTVIQRSKRNLANEVFSDQNKLKQLNGIIHPAVQADFTDWIKKQDAPYVLKEAAILFESGSYKNCDAVILVTAPIETRIDRVIQRDSTTKNEVLARIEKQWTDAKKIPLSDFIIVNDGSTSIIKQVMEIHQQLI